AGGGGVGGGVVLEVLRGGGGGERDQGRLGRGVGRHLPQRYLRCVRRDVQDDAPAVLAHGPERELCQEERALEVGVADGVPVALVHFVQRQQRRGGADRPVIYQGVQRPQTGGPAGPRPL